MTQVPVPAASVPMRIEKEVGLLRLLRTRLWLGRHAALIGRIERALDLAACPTCAEAQADGVPCEGADSPCDRCARALVHICSLRAELEQAVALEEGALLEPIDI
jgi:hypothetical protein